MSRWDTIDEHNFKQLCMQVFIQATFRAIESGVPLKTWNQAEKKFDLIIDTQADLSEQGMSSIDYFKQVLRNHFSVDTSNPEAYAHFISVFVGKAVWCYTNLPGWYSREQYYPLVNELWTNEKGSRVFECEECGGIFEIDEHYKFDSGVVLCPKCAVEKYPTYNPYVDINFVYYEKGSREHKMMHSLYKEHLLLTGTSKKSKAYQMLCNGLEKIAVFLERFNKPTDVNLE
jgi:hypothetical protein